MFSVLVFSGSFWHSAQPFGCMAMLMAERRAGNADVYKILAKSHSPFSGTAKVRQNVSSYTCEKS